MTAQIISRAEWGARYRDGDIALTNKAGELFIHHSAGEFTSKERADEEAHMRHLELVGYRRFGVGISYNVLVFPSGRAYRGVSWNRRGTHTGGRNSTARSICFVGNFEHQEPTEAALRTVGEIIEDITGTALKPNFVLRRHRDVKATACPGKNIAGIVPELLTKWAPDAQPSKKPSTGGKPTAKPKDDEPALLKIDGSRGPASIERWQWSLGTVQDRQVSRPRSVVVEADQHFLNKKVSAQQIKKLTGATRLNEDGIEGPKTVRVRQWYLFNMYPKSFEGYFGRAPRQSDYDGSNGPMSVKMHQHALNAAKKGKGY